MRCGDIMTRSPAYCVPTESAASVARLMQSQGVGSIPVCDDRHSRKLIGIVTDRDLALVIVAEARDANKTFIQEVMSHRQFACYSDEDLQLAVDGMQQFQLRRVPIIDRSGELVGIIAQADLANRGVEPEITAQTVEEISKRAG